MRKIVIPSRSNETDREIDKKLKNRFSILNLMTQAAISGDVKSLIISGPAGLGKSFTVEKALENWDPEKSDAPKDDEGKSLTYLNVGTGKDISIKELARIISSEI